jgi:para-nitrobenzyl esterase
MLITTLLMLMSVNATAPKVQLPTGTTITGKTSTSTRGKPTNVDNFLGLQYATVNQRFEPATLKYEKSSTTIDATEFGFVCVQANHNIQMSEDCLYLNVYRPSTSYKNKDLLPVMVWIHGGGFNNGAGSDYDPTNLVASQSVIVVTINYRLGPLGFLMKDNTGKGGMNGISDQILSLQWVKENIHSFGGDSNQVTIFGESAGSLSVCALIVAPSAKGLMKRAIMESGACTGVNWGPASVKEGWEATNLHLKYLKAKNVDELQNRIKYPFKTVSSWNPMCFPPTCWNYGWGIDPSMLNGAVSMKNRYMEGKDVLNVESIMIG